MTGTFLFEHSYRGNIWRLQVTEYHGRTSANFRRWYDAGGGELRPTRTGVTIPLERLPELHTALGEWIAENPPRKQQTV